MLANHWALCSNVAPSLQATVHRVITKSKNRIYPPSSNKCCRAYHCYPSVSIMGLLMTAGTHCASGAIFLAVMTPVLQSRDISSTSWVLRLKVGLVQEIPVST